MGAKIKNLDAYMARLNRIAPAAKEAVGAALQTNAQELSGAIARACDDDPKLSASVGYAAGAAPAGTLGAGDSTSQALASQGLSYTVFAGEGLPVPAVATWREFGTQPHAEDAKGKVMAFDGRDGEAFTPHVDNPGEHAQPYFYPTYRAWKKRLNSRASRAGSAAIKEAFAE